MTLPFYLIHFDKHLFNLSPYLLLSALSSRWGSQNNSIRAICELVNLQNLRSHPVPLKENLHFNEFLGDFWTHFLEKPFPGHSHHSLAAMPLLIVFSLPGMLFLSSLYLGDFFNFQGPVSWAFPFFLNLVVIHFKFES